MERFDRPHRPITSYYWSVVTTSVFCTILARAACMPHGLYVLLALISFFKKPFSKENSGSTELIFTKFSPQLWHVVDYRFELLFPMA